MLYTLCIVLILIASVLIVLAVLVQSPKSGMAANFGASNQIIGERQTADFLEKFTWGMAVAILVLSLLATLAMNGNLGSDSSNSTAAKDASALIEKITTTNEPVMPQAEIPAAESDAVAPVAEEEAPAQN